MFSKTFINKIDTTLNETVLTNLINVAMSSLPKFDIWGKNSYYLLSEDLKIIGASLNKTELDSSKGIIISVILEYGDDIWEPFTRSFVNFFNENFNRNFQYREWYEPELEENFTEELIDDISLIEFYDKVCWSVACHSYLNVPLSVIVDNETLEIIAVVPETEKSNYNDIDCKCLNIDPTQYTSYLFMSEDCQAEIYDKFGFDFEREMFYEFEIYENYEDEEDVEYDEQ